MLQFAKELKEKEDTIMVEFLAIVFRFLYATFLCKYYIKGEKPFINVTLLYLIDLC